jgi:hypothetical protein
MPFNRYASSSAFACRTLCRDEEDVSASEYYKAIVVLNLPKIYSEVAIFSSTASASNVWLNIFAVTERIKTGQE